MGRDKPGTKHNHSTEHSCLLSATSTKPPARSTMIFTTFMPHLRHTTGHLLPRIGSLGAVMLLAACQADKSSSISTLEQRKAEINAELPTLAYISLNSGVSSIGYRSNNHLDPPAHSEWVDIDLGEPVTLDEIILVPTIWRGANGNFQADAFPAAFTITARESAGFPITIIADYPDTSSCCQGSRPWSSPLNQRLNSAASGSRPAGSINGHSTTNTFFSLLRCSSSVRAAT